MIEAILWILLSLIASVIVFLVTYARWYYGTLEKLGIPVVKPHFLLGSDPKGHLLVGQHVDYERYKALGPIYGAYEGRVPRVFICDPEMIRLILVKDFDHFKDRTPMELGHEIYDQLLDFLPGEKWKTVRSSLTPMFTSSRLKQSTKMIQALSTEYINDLKKTFTGSRKKFNMKNFMATLITDLTGKTFLAIELPDRKDPNNYLVQLMKSVAYEEMEANFFFTLIASFPFLVTLFGFGPTEGVNKFVKALDDIMDQRRKSGTNLNDFIDVMIGMIDRIKSHEYKKLGITGTTIRAQAVEMFVAGYDSVSASLSILTYYFAKHPEIQEKLVEEIDSVNKKYNEDINYDALMEELPFLTACIKEAIRLSPAFPRIERQCTKAWTHEGLTIKKGMSVIIPSWATNRNADAFPDPEKFDPERFLGENDNKNDINQYAFTTFGFGPRNCIGMRMAYIIIKVVLIDLFKNFTIEIRPDTKADVGKGFAMVTRYAPIEVDLIKRNSVEE